MKEQHTGIAVSVNWGKDKGVKRKKSPQESQYIT